MVVQILSIDLRGLSKRRVPQVDNNKLIGLVFMQRAKKQLFSSCNELTLPRDRAAPDRAFLMSQECETCLEAIPEQHVLTGFNLLQ